MSQNLYFDSRSCFRNLRLIFILAVSLCLSCGQNVYSEMSNKTSEEALLEDAIKYMNASPADYDNAVAKLDQITSGFRREARVIKAIVAAYAGQCGLDFFGLINSLTAVTTDTPFVTFMKVFQNTTVAPTSCQLAQSALESVYGAASGSRDANQNLRMALIGISKIGTNLRKIYDANQDGTVDGGTTCLIATIPDADVIQVGTGLALLLDNLSALTAAVSGNAAITGLAALQAACGAPCTITDPTSASWNAAAIQVLSKVIDSNTYGVLACADPTLATCCLGR